jgi:serine protease Do
VLVTPLERPLASSVPVELRAWGMVAANLSASEARELGRESTDGVRVLSVRPGGPAEQARPAVVREDVIVEIDGQPVRSVEELLARTNPVRDRDGASFLVGVDRGLERRLTVVDLTESAVLSDDGVEASRAWVPIGVQVLTPGLASRLGLAGRTGVRVTRVIDPAVPLAVGDVILAIDGNPVRASAPTDEDVFAAMIRRIKVGTAVTLAIQRDGRAMAVPVTLAASPKPARAMAKYESAEFEFQARDLVEADAADPRLAGATQGVLVESVSSGGWAALGRLAIGDIILQVDGRTVTNVADLAARLDQIATARPATVLVQVRRGIRTLFLEIRKDN